LLDFRILGPLEVSADGKPVRLGGPKQRATLAILLLDANRVVSVDRLADDLYAGAAPVTAVTQIQRQVSELRKLLGPGHGIETKPPGYVLRLTPEQLDLHRFERLAADAGSSLERGDAENAAGLLRAALELWRGPPLADLGYESFAQPAIARLGEIRLAALEQRIDAELTLGRHARLVGELEQLVAENPLQERLAEQLMRALYRSGRQAEALDVYRSARERLVEALGLEPTSRLQALERAILAHDPALEPTPSESAAPSQAILVVASAAERFDALLAVAEPLGALPGRDLVVACLVEHERDLEPEAAAVSARCASLAAPTRTAVFTTLDPPGDIARLADTSEVGLVLVDVPSDLDGEGLPAGLSALLESTPADLGVLSPRSPDNGGAGVFIPFGGGEHDWAALELGAWLASATGESLCLLGTKAGSASGRRDASRLLADASLAAQRVVGIETRPVLAEPTEDALVASVEGAALVVAGISPRWRNEGIGSMRRALVRHARPPVLLVHRGPRPSVLAPREARTNFTWTLES
jgi:DNA-binding SARP family transcriptional activator/nucleotide-binding universal stress UspA family protein